MTDGKLASGDYVELIGLKQADLNAEKVVIVDLLETGRLCVELGAHKMMRKVRVTPEHIRVIAPISLVQDLQHRRDQGHSVASVISQGYSVAALQRDDSMALCADCRRPRYMCSCTFEFA